MAVLPEGFTLVEETNESQAPNLPEGFTITEEAPVPPAGANPEELPASAPWIRSAVNFLRDERAPVKTMDAIVSGTVKATSELGQTVVDIGQAGYSTLTDQEVERWEVPWKEAVDEYSDLMVEPNSVYEIPEALSQFLSVYKLGSKGLARILGKPTTAKGVIAQATTAGFIADFSAFNPYEQRVSDLLWSLTAASKNPDKATLYSDFLELFKSDPEGTAIENRLKAGTEGVVLGLGVELLGATVGRVFKKANAVRTEFGDQAAADIIDAEVQELGSLVRTAEDNMAKTTREEVERAVEIERAGVREAKEGEKKAFNVDNLGNLSEGARAEVGRIADTIDQRGVQSMASLTRSTVKTLKSSESIAEVTKAVKEIADSGVVNPESIILSRSLLTESSDRLATASAKGSQEELATATQQVLDSLDAVVKLQETAGRSLRATRESGIKPEDLRSFFKELDVDPEIIKFLDNTDTDAALRKLKEDIKVERSRLESRAYPEDVIEKRLSRFEAQETKRIAREANGRFKKAFDKITTIQAAAMLSGIGTHTLAISSGMMLTVVRPLFKIFGGVLGRNARQIREGFAIYEGLARGATDKQTWKQIGNAFKEGTTTTTRTTSSELISDWSGNGWWSWIKSNGYKTPLHMLAAVDEGFQRVNATAAARAQAKERLRAQLGVEYKNLSKAEKEPQIRAIVDEAFDKGQIVDDYIRRYAQSITMTGELEGGIGGALENFFRQSPILKALVMPFFRVPMNALREGVGSIPLAGYVSETTKRALRSTDPQVQNELYASWVATGGLMYLIGNKAANGEVTGGYSKNREVRAAQQATGIQPYSIKIGDNWYSFQRLEPIAVPLRMVADAVTTIQNSTFDPEDDWDELSGVVTMSVFNSIFENSMLRPMSDLVSIFTSEDEAGFVRYIEGLVGRFSPAGWQQLQAHNNGDTIKLATNTIERLKRTYAIGELPTKRNWISGKPIQKFYGADPTRSVEDKQTNKVALSLEAIGGYSAPDNKLANGTEMNAKQFDRYIEVMSTTRIGGYTMEQRLAILIDNPNWGVKNWRTGDNKSWHQTMVGNIISSYQSAAEATVLREFKELRDDYIERERSREYDRAGLQQ